jgi:hypothetical protein
MKLKNQRPGPKGAVEPVGGKKIQIKNWKYLLFTHPEYSRAVSKN